MQNMFSLPSFDNSRYRAIFPGRSDPTTTGDWQVWEKPLDIEWVFMLVVGGGAGGGSGFSGGGGSAGGGGGGGSAGFTTFMAMASLLPERLFVRPASIALKDTNGTLSYVSIDANTSANNLLQVSGAAAAVKGVAGAGSGTAAGGAGSTASSLPAGNPLSGLGIVYRSAGQTGGAGGFVTGTGNVGVNISPLTGTASSAGAGGATTVSADFAGGDQTLTISGGTAGGGAGGDGIWILAPPASTGGSGGGSFLSGTGGKGGDGAKFGSGGAGGGGGSTGGAGGKGAPGIIYIVGL